MSSDSDSASAHAPACRLDVELHALGRNRTVSLDFADASTLYPQLAQIAQRDTTTFGVLLEFTNEAGETLAFVASAYVSHAVRSPGT